MRLVPFRAACQRVGLTPGAVKKRLQGRTRVSPPFVPVRAPGGRLLVYEHDIEAYMKRLPRVDEPRVSGDQLFSIPRERRPECRRNLEDQNQAHGT